MSKKKKTIIRGCVSCFCDDDCHRAGGGVLHTFDDVSRSRDKSQDYITYIHRESL